MARCRGVTRAGKKPCSISANCTLTDDHGRSAAEPLRRGGAYCVFHAKPFNVRPAGAQDGKKAVLVFLDLETTGIDVARDRIVELAAMHAPDDDRFLGGSFCTVVCVEPQILEERGGEAAEVHGIGAAEIAQGPSFPEAWGRFLAWIDELLSITVASDAESEAEGPSQPRPPDEPPYILLAAHNGVRS